jgi:hypothetical protein
MPWYSRCVFKKLLVVPIVAALVTSCAELTARNPGVASAPWAPVSCSTYSRSGPSSLSGCTHTAETGGSAQFIDITGCSGALSCPVPLPDQPNIRVVFADDHGSVDISRLRETRTHPNECAKGREYVAHATVLAVRGPVSRVIGRGEEVLAFLCYHPSAALLFGTRFVL